MLPVFPRHPLGSENLGKRKYLINADIHNNLDPWTLDVFDGKRNNIQRTNKTNIKGSLIERPGYVY